jgi:hypothetical protein
MALHTLALGRGRNKNHYRYICFDKDGVSNIVTSIMMLGIVMTILGMILTVYVPMWARSNEIGHLDDVNDAFVDLKITIDNQVMTNDMGSKYSTRIKLGAGGGPVLGIGRSAGGLDFDSGRATIIVYQSEDTLNIYGEGGGNLVFESNNNYYVDQDFILENGAIIVKQGDSAVMKAEPALYVQKDPVTNLTSLELTTISMVGNHKSIGGNDDRIVDTILTSDMNTPHEFNWYENNMSSGQNITIRFNTMYPDLWLEYFNDTLGIGTNLVWDADGNGSTYDGDYYITVTDYSGSDPMLSETKEIYVNVQNVMKLDCKQAVIAVTIN